MSASERLAARFEEIGEAEDIGVPVPEIVAVVQAAERAERKLHYEYRTGRPYLIETPAEAESWAEGEALANALAALEEAL